MNPATADPGGTGQQKTTRVAGWFQLPRKYERADTSPLTTQVKAGPNPFDIELAD